METAFQQTERSPQRETQGHQGGQKKYGDQASPQPVPVVPLTALVTPESGSNSYSVFTIQQHGGKQFAQLKSVRIGEAVGKSVVINEGLLSGERIIVNRTNQLSDGSLVRIVE